MRKLLAAALLVAAGAVALLVASSPAGRHLRAARRLAARGMLHQAEAEFTLATRWNDRLPAAWLGLAEIHARMGRLHVAREDYRRALEAAPPRPAAALLGLGRLLLLTGEDNELENLAAKAAALGETAAAHELTAMLALARAQGKLLEAQKMLAKLDPGFSLNGAISDLRAQAEAVENAAPIHDLLREAANHANTALEEASLAATDTARLLRAQAYRLLGDAPAAEAAAAEVGDSDRAARAAAMLLLARTAEERGDAAAALRRVGEALTIDPANVPARLELKRARLEMEDFRSSLLDIDSTPRAAVGTHTSRAYRQGLLELLAGNHTQAVARLEEAVRSAPNWLQARMTLAAALYTDDPRTCKPARALKHLREIAAREPELIAPHVAMAQILLETGSARSAIDEARAALALDPVHPHALELLSQALLATGRISEAADALDTRLRNARRHDPSLERLQQEYQRHFTTARGIYNGFATTLLYLARGELDRAQKRLAEMRLIDPTAPVVDFLLARVQLARGRHAEAIETLAKAMEQMKWILERDYAESLGYAGPDELTDAERRDALLQSRVMADFHLEAARIALLADDLQLALQHSEAALEYDATFRTALVQTITARRRLAERLMRNVQKELERLAPALARQKLAERRNELAAREKLDDAEQKELESLNAAFSLDGRYAMVSRCARYAAGDQTAFSSENEAIVCLRAIRDAVERADDELARADFTLTDGLVRAPDDPLFLAKKAELCEQRSAVWEPAVLAVRTVLPHARELRNELRNERQALEEADRTEEGLSLAERARLQARKEQVSEMVVQIVRLEGELSRVEGNRDRYARLARQFAARAEAAAGGRERTIGEKTTEQHLGGPDSTPR